MTPSHTRKKRTVRPAVVEPSPVVEPVEPSPVVEPVETVEPSPVVEPVETKEA